MTRGQLRRRRRELLAIKMESHPYYKHLAATLEAVKRGGDLTLEIDSPERRAFVVASHYFNTEMNRVLNLAGLSFK